MTTDTTPRLEAEGLEKISRALHTFFTETNLRQMHKNAELIKQFQPFEEGAYIHEELTLPIYGGEPLKNCLTVTIEHPTGICDPTENGIQQYATFLVGFVDLENFFLRRQIWPYVLMSDGPDSWKIHDPADMSKEWYVAVCRWIQNKVNAIISESSKSKPEPYREALMAIERAQNTFDIGGVFRFRRQMPEGAELIFLRLPKDEKELIIMESFAKIFEIGARNHPWDQFVQIYSTFDKVVRSSLEK